MELSDIRGLVRWQIYRHSATLGQKKKQTLQLLPERYLMMHIILFGLLTKTILLMFGKMLMGLVQRLTKVTHQVNL
ncbi:hypothetical protein C2M05_04200 [Serratia marcescens]|nr:hypothetical protein C2M05_04200 [Serratia marcescens]